MAVGLAVDRVQEAGRLRCRSAGPRVRDRVRLVRGGRRARRRGLRRRGLRHAGEHVRARSAGSHAPNLAALGLGHLTEIAGVAPAAERRDRARPRDGAIGRKGHDDRPLGDDGHRPGPAVPALPGRVPARGHRAVRAGDRPRGPRATPASGTEIIAELGEEHLRDRAAHRVHERRLGVPDRRPTWTSSPWSSCTSGAGSRARILDGRAPGGKRDRPAVRRRAGGVRAHAGAARLLGAAARPDASWTSASTRGSPSTGSARSGTSSPGRASPSPATRDSNDDGVDLTVEYLAAAGPRPRLRQPRGLRLEVRASQRPGGLRPVHRGVRPTAPGADRRVGGGLMFLTGDHGCDPTTPSTDHSRERTPLLVSGCRGRPASISGPRAHVRRPRRDRRRRAGVDPEDLAGRASPRRSGGRRVTAGIRATSSAPNGTVGRSTADDLARLRPGYARGEVADYLAAAFLMAAYLQRAVRRGDRRR